jgi:CheY-like chemotaxis protein
LARKILLADDSVTAQNMGRKILADAGYEVLTVNNGSAALKKIAELKPDLVILDVYMPGYSGLEVCQRLKEAQETSRLPVLLTVGKLEPFKAEEAKRVRADSFIVKPFEASELLGAISKLEDKIVPRAEASKPGRLARATAAIEEGRYDKNTSASESDSGWKNRISFPHQKNEKTGRKDSDGQDLPTIVEHKRAEKPHAAEAEEGRVDLGALAPEGLPANVTPEEIAALAAAAAQVKGTIAESRFAEPAPVESGIEETEQSQSAAVLLPEGVANQETPTATFAEQKSEAKYEEKFAKSFVDKIDASLEKSSEAAAEAAGVAAARHSDLMAAIAGLEPEGVAAPGTSSGNEFSEHSSHLAADPSANEPVVVSAGSGAGHWTAVSVALAPEEAAISLEHEMQKAYAAFAAAEIAHAAVDTAVPEPGERAVATDYSLPAESLSLPADSIPAMPAPEAAQSLSELANASTEVIRAAVQELEMVAESYAAESPEAASGIADAAVAQSEAEASSVRAQTVVASGEESVPSAVEEQEPDAGKLETTKPDDPESSHPEPKHYGWTTVEPVVATAGAPEEDGTTAVRHESAASAFANEVPVEQASASKVSAYEAAAPASEPAAEDRTGMAKESDATANTAAAWASWRRIRESGDPKAVRAESHGEAEESPTAQDAAAMAVAAGAEKTPESAASESDPAAIASIVDSVLADLRPKIFEEISRKMGKKK